MSWDAAAAERYDATEPPAPPEMVSRLAALARRGAARAGCGAARAGCGAAQAGRGAAQEFAVGTGRVAVPLAGRGVPVSGIDSSPDMLARLPAATPRVLGDMTTATVPGPFTLVYLIYNGISNLLTQEEQVECFRNAARHLAPGGRFVIELWVPELRQLPPGREATVWHSEAGYIGLDTYDTLNQRVVSHHFRFGPGDGEAALFRSPHRS